MYKRNNFSEHLETEEEKSSNVQRVISVKNAQCASKKQRQ